MIERIRKSPVGPARLVTCAAVMALLQSCSHQASREGPATAGQQGILTLPSPPGYPARLTVVQQLHAVHGGQQTRLEAVLQLSDQRVSVVFTLPLGPRVATIQWTAEGVRVRSDLDTPETRRIPAERVLADVVLAFWPEDSVAAHLSPGLSLLAGPNERRVLRGNIPLAEVRIEDGADPWNGRTVVVHHVLDYRIIIDGRIPPSA